MQPMSLLFISPFFWLSSFPTGTGVQQPIGAGTSITRRKHQTFLHYSKKEISMKPQRKRPPRPEASAALDQLLTIKQAAAHLGISDSKFYRLMRDRQAGIPVLRMPGHTTRIPAAKLQDWIEKNTEQAT